MTPRLPRALKQALTEYDNETVDPVRLAAFLALLALIIFQALTLDSFNPINFASAVAAILGAIVAQDRFNLREPPKQPEPKP